MKVFPDTNVLLSAFFGRGLCADLLAALLEGEEHEIVIGEPVMREFVRIARGKFHVPDADLSYALEVCSRLTKAGAASRPYAAEASKARDPDDIPVLACALAAKVDWFVTGDKALLDLGRLSGMRIFPPRQGWQMLRGT